MENKIFTQLRVKKQTRDDLREVQGRYGCLTFDESILTLIENDAGVPFSMIKEMAEQGKTIADLLALSRRMGK